MLFIVTRASTWDTVKPCDEAVKQVTIVQREVRIGTVQGFISVIDNEPVYEYALRDFEVVEWTVELNSLEELILFTVKYGDCIVNQNTIEINDEEV